MNKITGNEFVWGAVIVLVICFLTSLIPEPTKEIVYSLGFGWAVGDLAAFAVTKIFNEGKKMK